MMRFKKLMALVLAAAMALTMLTACGGGGGGKATPTQKERYLSKINAVLSEKVPGAKKLTLESKANAKASLYKEKSENQKKFNDEDAKTLAGIDEEEEYLAFRLSITKKDTDKAKTEAIANEIIRQMKKQMGTDALKENEYKLDYEWGTTEKDDKKLYVYVVLRKVD